MREFGEMMGRWWFWGLFGFGLVFVLCVNGHPHPHPEEDLVVRLPGQPEVGFRQFAGYIDVDVKSGRSLFYYFVEAEGNPDSKALTLWLNGGQFFPFPLNFSHILFMISFLSTGSLTLCMRLLLLCKYLKWGFIMIRNDVFFYFVSITNF